MTAGKFQHPNVVVICFGLAIAFFGPLIPISKLWEESSPLKSALIGQAQMWALCFAVILIVLLGEKRPLSSIGLVQFRWSSLAFGLGLYVIQYLIAYVQVPIQNSLGMSFQPGLDKLYEQYYKNGTLEDTGAPWDKDTGPREDVTDSFMDEAAGYQIVFFLPDNLPKQAHTYGRNRGGYTFEEWQWLKARPHVMKDVIFVVGAENALIPGSGILAEDSNDPAYKRRDRALTELLKDPRPFLLR